MRASHDLGTCLETDCIKGHWAPACSRKEKWECFGLGNGSVWRDLRTQLTLWITQILALVHQSVSTSTNGVWDKQAFAEISSVKDDSKLELNTKARMALLLWLCCIYVFVFPRVRDQRSLISVWTPKAFGIPDHEGLAVSQLNMKLIYLFHCKLKQCQLFHLEFCWAIDAQEQDSDCCYLSHIPLTFSNFS